LVRWRAETFVPALAEWATPSMVIVAMALLLN
jgi:hypothetical protein